MSKKKDIDQGWAWVVLFAAFTSLTLQSMISVSTGLFQVEFLENFEGPRSYISLVCSMNTMCQLLLGVLASMLCNIFSIRCAAMFGASVYAFGLVLSSLSSSFEQLMFFYGVIAGCGSGLLYTPLCVITSHYFHEKRVIACGFIFSSSGIGYLAGPTLVRYLLETSGWRSALVILGCMAAQICSLAALFFPLEETPKRNCITKLCSRRQKEQISKINQTEAQLPLVEKPRITPQPTSPDNIQTNSPKSIYRIPKIKQTEAQLPLVEKLRNTPQSTSTDNIQTNSPNHKVRSPALSPKSRLDCSTNNSAATSPKDPRQPSSLSELRNGHHTSLSSVNSHNINDFLTIVKEGRSVSSLKPENKFITSLQSLSSMTRRQLNVSNSLLWESHSSVHHLGSQIAEMEKMGADGDEVVEESCLSVFKPDTSVLKNKAFWCLTLSQFFLMCGYCINFIHYPSMIVSNGIDISVVPQLYMTQGVSLIFARLGGGLFCNQPEINILTVSFGGQMLMGTLVFCMPFLGDVIWLYHLFQMLFACYYGVTYVVLSPILVQLLGLNHLATAFGLQMVAGGVAFAITPVLAGWLYDITKSYALAYHISGVIIFIGAAFVAMIHILEPLAFVEKEPEEIVIEVEVEDRKD